MQTITFYILPIASIQNIEKSIPRLTEICNQIKNNSDIIRLTQEFYAADINGKTFFDKIDLSKMDSTTKFIIQYFASSNPTSTPINSINFSDYHNQFIEIDDNRNLKDEFIIRTKEDLINYYQTSSLQLQDFSELFDWKKKCFPSLLFTEDSFGNNHKAFSDDNPTVFCHLYEQAIHCLAILNNQTDEFHSLSNEQKINALQTQASNIECTGKGRNEKQEFKKDVFITIDGSTQKRKLSCQPHFKLIRKDSDYRIYFSWGDNQIKHNTIIVVKLGNHWNSTSDSVLSEIIIT